MLGNLIIPNVVNCGVEILLDTAHLSYSKKNKIPMQNPNEVRMFLHCAAKSS